MSENIKRNHTFFSRKENNNEKTVEIEVRNSCNIFIIDEEGNIKGVGLIDSQGENFQIITQSLIELKK